MSATTSARARSPRCMRVWSSRKSASSSVRAAAMAERASERASARNAGGRHVSKGGCATSASLAPGPKCSPVRSALSPCVRTPVRAPPPRCAGSGRGGRSPRQPRASGRESRGRRLNRRSRHARACPLSRRPCPPAAPAARVEACRPGASPCVCLLVASGLVCAVARRREGGPPRRPHQGASSRGLDARHREPISGVLHGAPRAAGAGRGRPCTACARLDSPGWSSPPLRTCLPSRAVLGPGGAPDGARAAEAGRDEGDHDQVRQQVARRGDRLPGACEAGTRVGPCVRGA